MNKLASLQSVDLPEIGATRRTNKLKYLESRAVDILKNKNNFSKLSSDTTVGNLDLFTTSPKDYFLHVGYELLHYK